MAPKIRKKGGNPPKIGTFAGMITSMKNNYLICGVGIPYNKFAILGGRHKVPRIRTPMHGINLGKMSPERTSGTHLYSTHGFHILGSLLQSCVLCCFSGLLENNTIIIAISIYFNEDYKIKLENKI